MKGHKVDIKEMSDYAEDILSAIDENKGVEPRNVIAECLNALEIEEGLTSDEIEAIMVIVATEVGN